MWDEQTSEWQAGCQTCRWRHWRDARKECPPEDWCPGFGRYVDKVLEEYDKSLRNEMDRRAWRAHGLPARVSQHDSASTLVPDSMDLDDV